MTRAEKATKAQELRGEGLLLREIAEQMGAACSTVHAWLSDPDGSRLRARQDSYGGECETCGGRTSGCNGRAAAAKICATCLEWPDEACVDAIRRWAEEHGGVPPTMADWRASGPDHPAASVVHKRIGWNEAILRAGYALVCDRRPETQEWIEAQIRAGVPTQEIADALGCSTNNISFRLRTRGSSISELRRAA